MLSPSGLRVSLPQLNDNWDLVESGSFETASRAMAVHNDSVFRAAEDRLEVCNSAGERARGGEGACVESALPRSLPIDALLLLLPVSPPFAPLPTSCSVLCPLPQAL